MFTASPLPKGVGVSDLKKYKTEVNGTRTTLLLSDEDAKLRGLLKEAAPADKVAETPPNK